MRVIRAIVGLFGILLAAFTFMNTYMQLLTGIIEGGQFVFQIETLILSFFLVIGGIFAILSMAKKVIGKIASLFYIAAVVYYVINLELFKESIYIAIFLGLSIIVMWIPSKDVIKNKYHHHSVEDPTDKKLEQLKTLKALYDSNVLNEAEFLKEKAKILKK
jgi:hypothetical protein